MTCDLRKEKLLLLSFPITTTAVKLFRQGTGWVVFTSFDDSPITSCHTGEVNSKTGVSLDQNPKV